MPDTVTSALINAGILGPILVAVGWYVLRLQKQLSDAQEKRVEDAQRVAVQLLELNDRWADSVAEQTAAMDRHRQTTQRVHDLLTDLRESVRRPVYPQRSGGPIHGGSE